MGLGLGLGLRLGLPGSAARGALERTAVPPRCSSNQKSTALMRTSAAGRPSVGGWTRSTTSLGLGVGIGVVPRA